MRLKWRAWPNNCELVPTDVATTQRYLLFLNQSPGITRSTCAGRPSNTMHVLAHIHGCVVINNMRHVLDINASRYEIRADKPKDESVARSQARESPKHVYFLRPEFTQNRLALGRTQITRVVLYYHGLFVLRGTFLAT
jgi:hypothetical protein